MEKLKFSLFICVFLMPVSAFTQTTETPVPDIPEYIKAELVEIYKVVEKDFGYKGYETREDLTEIKKAALVLVRKSDYFKKTKTVQVYSKKTILEDMGGKEGLGYLILCVDSKTKRGIFTKFLESENASNIGRYYGGSIGDLKIEEAGVSCDECEGGLWTSEYIQEASNKLLKRKPFDLVIQDIKR